MIPLPAYLAEGGAFHDVVPLGFRYEGNDRAIMRLDDLNANWEGLPEYRGRQMGSLIFQGISSLQFEFDFVDGLMIYDLAIEAIDLLHVVIGFSPGGSFKVQCEQCFVVTDGPAKSL